MLLYLLTKDQLISSLADVDGRRGTRTLHLELLREPGWGASIFALSLKHVNVQMEVGVSPYLGGHERDWMYAE